MAIIDIRHVTKDYGQNRGIFDLDFQMNKGEIMGVLGPREA